MASGPSDRGAALLVAEGASAELLIEAGAVLAESLDLQGTLSRVAHLTIPRLSDMCVIDLLEADGSIRQMAVAASDEEVARGLRTLSERQQLNPAGEHPVARVIRSGEAELVAHMSPEEIDTFSEGSEHAHFMIEHGYRSAIVAPLLARSRTLGAFSILRLGGGRDYGADDVGIVCELARRAALAIDNARLFSEVQRVEQRLESILFNLAEAITLTDLDDRIVFANPAAARLFGVGSPLELMNSRQADVMRRFMIFDEHGHTLTSEHGPRTRLFSGEASAPLLLRVVGRESHEERWLIARPSPLADRESGRVMFAVNVYEDVTSVKRVQLAESFMAEASRVLASSLDYKETLRKVTLLAVPQLADWCVVDVLSETGEIERVAFHHIDPRKRRLAERLQSEYGWQRDEALGVPEVIRSGSSRIYTDIDPRALERFAHDDRHLELLSEVGARSVIIVPLAAPVRTVGALTLVTSESGRRLLPADLAVAERLGRRAGTAVESSRLYSARAHVARALESALLPGQLPQAPGLELEALYSPAGDFNQVGGDFYDVIAFGECRWGLVIGDVCGKGPLAAGVTALARHTLRTAAMLGQSPAGMLQTLNQALRRLPAGSDLCTACVVVLDTRTRPAELTVTLAGHPQPLLVGAEPERRLGQPGTLLGVFETIEVHEVRAELAAGQTLMLYTDGLPDAGRAGHQLSEEELLALCSRAARLPLREALEQIELRALESAGGALRDDVALLGVRLSPAPRS